MKRIAGILCVSFLFFTVPSQAQTSPGPVSKFRHYAPSHRNVLEHNRFRWEGDRLILKSVFPVSAVPDTLKILALMAEFQEDGDEETTGDGTFLDAATTQTIDPPPHDRAYFEAQLAALSHYYRTVSGGKLVLTSTVFPSVLTLPHGMGMYQPDREDEAADSGNCRLLRDAVLCADTAGAVFSDFDCFIVFHAGVGADIALDYDPTPKDIPSAFLSLETLRKYLGGQDPQYTGIPVQQGHFRVAEGLVLPETESQEGYEIGLLGTLCLYFGMQLGMPALWNTENGRSGIGKWGLMDQGSGNFSGLIPARPCAWTRMMMDWETPVERLSGNSIPVACAETRHADKMIRIPIHAEEYYLVENRNHDPNGDGFTRGWDADGNEIRFLADGTLQAAGAFGVIVRVEEYDFDLPGSGILVWHIDENVIRENWESNRINADPMHRGVDLEEADGAQDIGEAYDFLSPGSGAEYGVMHDAWFEGNEAHLLANRSTEVAFSDDTHPDSRSNAGGRTQLRMDGFSGSDTLMTFCLETGLRQSGFPRDFGAGEAPFSPLVLDMDGDGLSEIAVVSGTGRIFILKNDGSPFMAKNVQGYRLTATGDTVRFQVPLAADAESPVRIPSAAGDVNGDGCAELALAAGTELVIFGGTDADADSLADALLRWDAGDTLTSLILVPGAGKDRIVMGTRGGSLFSVSFPFTLDWQAVLGTGPVNGLCRFPSGGEEKVLAASASGTLYCAGNDGTLRWSVVLPGIPGLPVAGISGGGQVFWAVVTDGGAAVGTDGALSARFWNGGDSANGVSGEMHIHPGLADIDADGFPEVVWAAGPELLAYNHNGSLADGFPLSIGGVDDALLSGPVIGDLDGDGRADLLLASQDGNLRAAGPEGNAMQGFPLSAGHRLSSPPALADIDGDGDVEILFACDEGVLSILNLGAACSPSSCPWPAESCDFRRSGYNALTQTIPPPGEEWLPDRLVYNYPNPAYGNTTTIRYRLEEEADVRIQIFDLAGEEVAQLEGPGESHTENEVVWDISDVASGVYLACVSARSGGKEKTVLIKIAVAK